jgi:taurine dioxygenase
MLYELEVPELFGLALGDIEFASTAAAWDALPERMRRHFDGRRAVFDFEDVLNSTVIAQPLLYRSAAW